MSTTTILSEFAGDLEAAAITEDDPAISDACAVLAARARGEDPPRDAARRIVERYEGGAK